MFAPLTALVFWYTGMYRGSWRLAGVADLARACGAAAAVALAGAIVHPLLSPVSAAAVDLPDLRSDERGPGDRVACVVRGPADAASGGRVIRAFPCSSTARTRRASPRPASCSRTRPAGLKPIGFVDDDPGKTGRLVSGLPVLGRSYELESLITAHASQSGRHCLVRRSHLRCQMRIANACGRLGIRLFRMQVQLERSLEDRRPASTARARSGAGGRRHVNAAAARLPCRRRVTPMLRMRAVRQVRQPQRSSLESQGHRTSASGSCIRRRGRSAATTAVGAAG